MESMQSRAAQQPGGRRSADIMDIDAGVRSLLATIVNTRYFEPDGNPKSGWNVSSGGTLGKARGIALGAAIRDAKSIAQGKASDADFRAGAWGRIGEDDMEDDAVEAANEEVRCLGRKAVYLDGSKLAVSRDFSSSAAWNTIAIAAVNWIAMGMSLKVAKTAAEWEAASAAEPALRRAEGARRGFMSRFSDKSILEDAVQDAALAASLLAIKHWNVDNWTKHMWRASERMEVWAKGYCVAADVGGTLYVYRKDACAADIKLRA